MKKVLLTLILGLAAQPVLASQSPNACAVKFSIATQDALGNVDAGLSPDGQKWYSEKLQKHYPNVCYVEQKPESGLWFLLNITEQLLESATVTRNRVTPGITTIPTYTLKAVRVTDGKPELLRTFQTTGRTGIFNNPERKVIEDAVRWVSLNEQSLTTSN